MPEIADLHIPFAEFLTREGIPFIRARSDRESTIALGHPDFTLTLGNRVLMIEFKDKDGKTSADQKRRIAELERAGNLVLILRDLANAIAVTLAWRDSVGTIIPTGKSAPAELHVDEVLIGHVWYRRPAPGARYEFHRLAEITRPAPASTDPR